MTTDSTTDSTAAAQRCPRCGAANDCAIAQGTGQCWCMAEPRRGIPPASVTAGCYCRNCLRALSPVDNAAGTTPSA